MTKSETVIRSILGATRSDIRPLACAVDIAVRLMFLERIPMDDIRVTEDIYPEAAARMHDRFGRAPSLKTISRRIERLANLCWDTLAARDLVLDYIGAPLKDIRAPRDMIFYLAFYVYFDAPFFAVIHHQPALLF